MTDISFLRRLAAEHYHPTKIPGAYDADIASNLSGITTADSFRSFAVEVDAGVARVLSSFASRMAVLTLRQRDPAWIRYGLVAAQLAMTREDSRDVVSSYAILFRSAEELGCDGEVLFRDLSYLDENPLIETPAQFAGRSPDRRGIEVFGIMLVEDREGRSYRSNRRR